MVTVIWDGVIPTRLIPAGRTTLILRLYVPLSRSPTDTAPTSVDVSKALRDAAAPPRVTMTLGVERV